MSCILQWLCDHQIWLFGLTLILFASSIAFCFIRASKNVACVIMAIGVLLSLVFSVVALCVVCPRVIPKEDLGFDYIGVVVGILALLVVFTVSWQIYNAIDDKKKIRDEVIKEISQEIEDYLIQEDTTLLNAYVETKQWSIVVCFLSNLTHRYDYALRKNPNKDVSGFINTVGQIVNNIDYKAIPISKMYGIMELIKNMKPKDERINKICGDFDKNINKQK